MKLNKNFKQFPAILSKSAKKSNLVFPGRLVLPLRPLLLPSRGRQLPQAGIEMGGDTGGDGRRTAVSYYLICGKVGWGEKIQIFQVGERTDVLLQERKVLEVQRPKHTGKDFFVKK